MEVLRILLVMGKKKNTSEWIAEARAIWGNEFDYSRALYRTGREKITIGCRNCGFIEVIASNHVTSQKTRKPAGCNICNRAKAARKLTKPFAQMVLEARKIHGNRYEYLEHTYRGAKNLMQMVCPVHGKVDMTPDSHINRKSICIECGKTKKASDTLATRYLDLQKKISRLSHETVKLSFSSFKGQNFVAKFSCKEHGEFLRKPIQSILTRHPCPECLRELPNGSMLLSEKEIAARVNKLEGNFQINSIVGKGKLAKINISCLENNNHNPIPTRTLDNIYGKKFACPKCSHEAGQPLRTKNVKQAIDKKRSERARIWKEAASSFHKNKYDYSKSEYRDAHSEVLIGCPTHGIFSQTAGSHLSKGCKKCANENLKGRYTHTYFERYPDEKIKPAKLYYVRFSIFEKQIFKIGITINDISERFNMATGRGIRYQLLAYKELPLYRAFLREQEILASVSKSIQNELDEEQCDEFRKARIGITELIDAKLEDDILRKYFD